MRYSVAQRECRAREQAGALMAAMERIPEDYRRVVVWYQYEQLTFEEIGQRLGRSAEAAQALVSGTRATHRRIRAST